MGPKKIKMLTVILVLVSAGVSFAKSPQHQTCSDDQEIACQMEAYKKANQSCEHEVSECAAQVQMSFKNLESSFNRCLSAEESSREECQHLEAFVVEQVIPNNPSFGQVARALKFINQRAQSKAIGPQHASL